MYLKTNKQVEINDGLTSSILNYIYLRILNISYIQSFKGLSVSFAYYRNTAEEEPILVKEFSLVLDINTVNSLYSEQVKALMPSGLTEMEYQERKFYMGAKVLMLTELKKKDPTLTMNDIDLITNNNIW